MRMVFNANIKKSLILYLLARRRRKRKQRAATRQFFKLRPIDGEFVRTVLHLALPNNNDLFFDYFRMYKDDFVELLNLVQVDIQRAFTHSKPILPYERLALTLKILATGQSFASIGLRYRIHPSYVGRIFHETCHAICKNLSEFLKIPSTADDWRQIRNAFYSKWNFPNCLGAIDGKHIRIKAPPNSGSYFYNYKGYFSIVLLAVVDANYKFLMVDIGAYGRQSDGGTFVNSKIGQNFESKKFNFDEKSILPGTNILCNNVLIADEAFPLKDYMLRPYPGRQLSHEQRIFNYRLSRARRIVENAFGILVRRWAILAKTIELKPENVDIVVQACVLLHNFCMTRRHDIYAEPLIINFTAQNTVGPTQQSLGGGNRSKWSASILRDTFKDFFVSDAGKVFWQEEMI